MKVKALILVSSTTYYVAAQTNSYYDGGTTTSPSTTLCPEDSSLVGYTTWSDLANDIKYSISSTDQYTICPGSTLYASEGPIHINNKVKISCGTGMLQDDITTECEITGGTTHFILGESAEFDLNDITLSHASTGSIISTTTYIDAEFNNCVWTENQNPNGGAAVDLYDSAYGYPLVFDHCSFIQNDGKQGAVATSNSLGIFTYCFFQENTCSCQGQYCKWGSAITSVDPDGELSLSDCCFVENYSDGSGTVYVESGDVPTNWQNYGYENSVGTGQCTDMSQSSSACNYFRASFSFCPQWDSPRPSSGTGGSNNNNYYNDGYNDDDDDDSNDDLNFVLLTGLAFFLSLFMFGGILGCIADCCVWSVYRQKGISITGDVTGAVKKTETRFEGTATKGFFGGTNVSGRTTQHTIDRKLHVEYQMMINGEIKNIRKKFNGLSKKTFERPSETGEVELLVLPDVGAMSAYPRDQLYPTCGDKCKKWTIFGFATFFYIGCLSGVASNALEDENYKEILIFLAANIISLLLIGLVLWGHINHAHHGGKAVRT